MWRLCHAIYNTSFTSISACSYLDNFFVFVALNVSLDLWRGCCVCVCVCACVRACVRALLYAVVSLHVHACMFTCVHPCRRCRGCAPRCSAPSVPLHQRGHLVHWEIYHDNETWLSAQCLVNQRSVPIKTSLCTHSDDLLFNFCIAMSTHPSQCLHTNSAMEHARFTLLVQHKCNCAS